VFDCKVIIKESDEVSKFYSWALPLIESISDTKNLTHIFDKNCDEHFHRTKILNEMIMQTTTEIVVNYDSDIILPIESYVKAKEMLDSGKYDVIYPYKFGEKGERKVFLDTKIEDENDLNHLLECSLIKEFVSNFCPEVFDNSYNYAQNMNGIGWAEYGMVQFFNTEVYKNGYLENENFIAYAPEDVERYYRWKKLEYEIGRIDNHAYHLEHKRTQNSWFNNPFMKKNNELWEKLKIMEKQELIDYYKNQTYVKEKLK